MLASELGNYIMFSGKKFPGKKSKPLGKSLVKINEREKQKSGYRLLDNKMSRTEGSGFAVEHTVEHLTTAEGWLQGCESKG